MSESPAERKLFKDYLDARAVHRLADTVERAWPAFDRAGFERAANEGLTALELSGRVAHVGRALRAHLPGPFPEVAEILSEVAALWPRARPGETGDGFAIWPVFNVVPEAGLDDFDRGMALLKRLTPLFSAEMAIRPFLDRYGARAFALLETWTADPDEHVRRLVSEGTRPRLPWATRVSALLKDPRPGLRLLDRLVDDPALYVRRSVANHLNDVSKDHPDLAVATARRWLEAPTAHRQWVVKHALRSLIKAGHGEVFDLLGHGSAPSFEGGALSAEPARVPWGGQVSLRGEVRALAAERWVLDWAVTFVGARGQGRRKVFKGTQVQVSAGQVQPFRAQYDFRPITTRRYYPGEHGVELLVNGQVAARASFTLLPPVG